MRPVMVVVAVLLCGNSARSTRKARRRTCDGPSPRPCQTTSRSCSAWTCRGFRRTAPAFAICQRGVGLGSVPRAAQSGRQRLDQSPRPAVPAIPQRPARRLEGRLRPQLDVAVAYFLSVVVPTRDEVASPNDDVERACLKPAFADQHGIARSERGAERHRVARRAVAVGMCDRDEVALGAR